MRLCCYIFVAITGFLMYNDYIKKEEVIVVRDHNCFLSIVIPVYNTEKYLKRCLDSALAAAIDSMQIILVDDGSTDGSPQICDQYAAAHANVTVIHRENSGVSATRNAGLRAATGRYIFFLDSDDAVEQGIFAKFHDYISARETEPDMVMFDCVFVHDATGEESPFVFPVAEKLHNISGLEALKFLLDAKLNFEWYLWRYFYRRDYLEEIGLAFLEGITYEDVAWTSQALIQARLVDYMPVIGLRYTNFRKNSIVNSMSLKKVCDKLFVSAHACRFDMEHIEEPELLSKMLSNHAEYYVGAFRNYCEFIPDAYPYVKEYVWLSKYSKTRFGKFVYKSTSLLGFRLGSLLSKMMFKILRLDR